MGICNSSNIILLFQVILAVSVPLPLHTHFRNSLSISQNSYLNFYLNSTNSVNQFGGIDIFTMLSLRNHHYNISLHLFSLLWFLSVAFYKFQHRDLILIAVRLMAKHFIFWKHCKWYYFLQFPFSIFLCSYIEIQLIFVCCLCILQTY